MKLHLLPHQPGRQRQWPVRGSQWELAGLHWHCFLQVGAHQPGSQRQAPVRGSQRPWGPHWQGNWQSPPQWLGSQVQRPLAGSHRPLGWHGQLRLQSGPQYCSGQPVKGRRRAAQGGRGSLAAPPASRLAKGMARAEPWGSTHGTCSLLRRSRVGSGKPQVSRTPRPPRRHPPPRTVLSAAGWARQRTMAPPGSRPAAGPPGHLAPGQPSRGNRHPASRSIPPAEPQHHQQLAGWVLEGPHSTAPHRRCSRRAAGLLHNTHRRRGATRPRAGTELWASSPSITHRPCTPALPASSQGSTPGRWGACGRDAGAVSRGRGPGAGAGSYTASQLQLRLNECGRLPRLGPVGGEAARSRGHRSGRKPTK